MVERQIQNIVGMKIMLHVEIHLQPHFYKWKVFEASYIKLADQPKLVHQSVEIRPQWLHLLKHELTSWDAKMLVNDFEQIKARIVIQWFYKQESRPV